MWRTAITRQLRKQLPLPGYVKDGLLGLERCRGKPPSWRQLTGSPMGKGKPWGYVADEPNRAIAPPILKHKLHTSVVGGSQESNNCIHQWARESRAADGYCQQCWTNRSNAFLWVRLQRLQEDIRCDRLIQWHQLKVLPRLKPWYKTHPSRETSPPGWLIASNPRPIHNNSSSRWSDYRVKFSTTHSHPL